MIRGIKKMLSNKVGLTLFIIIFTASILRVWNITVHDSYTDEVSYSFRSIGLIDFDTSPTQTSPWQWLESVPWWMHLSFHDHPILFFLAEHFSLLIMGQNLLAIRLPAVIFGFSSIIFIFFLAKHFFDEKIALFASSFLAVNSYHIWISRLGIQDGMVIFILLLSIYTWIKSEKNKKYWLLWGLITGLGIITKYTSLIIFPILLSHALIYKRKIYLEKNFWYSLAIILLVSSPVLIYNLFLYKLRGHFDFQISAALGQNVPEWTFRMGREQVGNLANRLKNFFLLFHNAQSLWSNILMAFSFLSLPILFWVKKEKKYLFIFISSLLMCLWFLIIGSTYRFLIMLVPFLILSLSAGIYQISKYKKIINVSCFIFIIAEVIFSVNSFLLVKSYGPKNIAYASINQETQNYGFNQLNEYLANLLDKKYSKFKGEFDYSFLKQFSEKYIEKKKEEKLEPLSLIIIYDSSLNKAASLWAFGRRIYYQGWIIMNEDIFYKYTQGNLDNFYRNQGVEKFIYIQAASNLVKESEYPNQKETDLQKYLKEKKINPIFISNALGEKAFAVFEF